MLQTTLNMIVVKWLTTWKLFSANFPPPTCEMFNIHPHPTERTEHYDVINNVTRVALCLRNNPTPVLQYNKRFYTNSFSTPPPTQTLPEKKKNVKNLSIINKNIDRYIVYNYII